MDLNGICEKLDEMVVEFFDNIEQLYCEQNTLQELMKDGFLNMSRARYNMGVKAVGVEQFHENEMKARSKVDVLESESKNTFQLSSSSIRPSPSVSHVAKKIEDVGLRKRNVGDTDSEKSIISKTVEDLDDGEVDIPIVDPIKWYGILVPQNLRKCQSSFKQAVETAVKIANLQNTISSLQTEYRLLLKKKAEIEKEKLQKEETQKEEKQKEEKLKEETQKEEKPKKEMQKERKPKTEKPQKEKPKKEKPQKEIQKEETSE